MQASKVDTTRPEVPLYVQGFQAGGGFEPYVWIGSPDDDEGGFMLTPEGAHILSEEIRKHAESISAEQGE